MKLKATIAAAVGLGAAMFSVPAWSADAVSTVAAATAPHTDWPGPTEPVQTSPGKTVYAITCASEAIGCARTAKGITQAGKALGWEVRTIDGRGDPQAWNGGVMSAIAAKASGIVLIAVPPMLVGDALKKANDAGIPVVTVYGLQPGASDGIFAYVRPDHEKQGGIAADWVNVDSGGQAKIILVEDTTFPDLAARVSGFRKEIKSCALCEVVETVQSTLPTMAQRLPGAVAAALSRHPDANYLIAPFDSNAFFANEGIRLAGRIGKVKVGSYEGDPQIVAAIHQGQFGMTQAAASEWMGWQAADELARAFAGAKPANIPVTYRLLEAKNAPNTEGWLGDLDYQAAYKRLWGVK
jgi:ribose transport system substrate-binding protein